MIERIHQRVVESILYPLLARYHSSRELSIAKELQQSERFSEDELHALRLQRLKKMLQHAAKYVPFYQERFEQSDFNPDNFSDFSDLKKIPILTKQDIQENRERLISGYYARDSLQENRTGGSTGSPLVFYHDKQRLDSRQAATLRHNFWAGYRVGCKAAILWGHQHDLSLYISLKAKVRQALIDRTLICDSSSFSEESLLDFTKKYMSFKPEIVLAYANSLALVVDFCTDRGVELPSPKAIITSAEVLTEQNRQRIEDYFQTKIFDRYGAREVSVIASECEAHQGMHINAENLYLEFLDGDKDAPAGENGEIIITDLGNFAFPFIRYQIGDIGAKTTGLCSCGRTLPRMAMIAGRTTDFLLAPDGRMVSGAAMTIYLAAEVPGIRQAQIIQKEQSKLIFNLVVDGDFDKNSQEQIREKVDHFFGREMEYSLNFLAEIPRESSGKYRFSICEL